MRHRGPAWYFATREDFLRDPADAIANQLAGRAASENLEILSDQQAEWQRSVRLLQRNLQRNLEERIPILRQALEGDAGAEVDYVILEYDFRRHGLRMDCVLLAKGALFVIEFKRSKLAKSDRDQVMTYAMNLIEFHKVTREWSERQQGVLVPILALTEGKARLKPAWPGLGSLRWSSLAQQPLQCDRESLGDTLALAISARRSTVSVALDEWLDSPFEPSSSIVDATLSLYGNHDVSAIREHAASTQEIEATTTEIREHIERALEENAYHIICLSGAPGAGKTLVGLDLVMRGRYERESVFVTGNAPLVEVLNKALRSSYRTSSRQTGITVPFGYPRRDAAAVADAATVKIVKAHHFLGERGAEHRQYDGRVLVFDEAQRTYEKGRQVVGKRLKDHEADLILKAQKETYSGSGSVVVALIGHNQAINNGERGMIAWLEAAEKAEWSFSLADETLTGLERAEDRERWANHPLRLRLEKGHLHQSLRYYRNAAIERWVSELLGGSPESARDEADALTRNGDAIWLTRSLADARRWARSQALGEERVGLIATGQARRLAAEGLFVELKPDIATWMLAPSVDIRSSNALETVQNQFQIQGLELDFTVVCWDADLRREKHQWAAYKLNGDDWKKTSAGQVALNSYRVLLTRARKGMLIFVPPGDVTGRDRTRHRTFYDGIADHLERCGAQTLEPAGATV